MVKSVTIVSMVKYVTIVCERSHMVWYVTIVCMVKSITIIEPFTNCCYKFNHTDYCYILNHTITIVTDPLRWVDSAWCIQGAKA